MAEYTIVIDEDAYGKSTVTIYDGEMTEHPILDECETCVAGNCYECWKEAMIERNIEKGCPGPEVWL